MRVKYSRPALSDCVHLGEDLKHPTSDPPTPFEVPVPGEGVAPAATHVNANGDLLPPPPPVDQPGLVARGGAPHLRLKMLPLGASLLKSNVVGVAALATLARSIMKPRKPCSASLPRRTPGT